jgi:hypothetical protein
LDRGLSCRTRAPTVHSDASAIPGTLQTASIGRSVLEDNPPQGSHRQPTRPPKLFSRAIILMDALMPARVDEMRLDHALPVVALLLVFIAGAITSFLNPQSGGQDRMAHTKVVAR